MGPPCKHGYWYWYWYWYCMAEAPCTVLGHCCCKQRHRAPHQGDLELHNPNEAEVEGVAFTSRHGAGCWDVGSVHLSRQGLHPDSLHT